MEYVLIFWSFTAYTMNIQATTHWMVTETGSIQPKHDSRYELALPHDLMQFLSQDIRWEQIIILSEFMSSKQIVINKYWSDLVRDTDIISLLSRSDNCVKAGSLSTLDWYLSHFEDGSRRNIEEAEFMLYNPSQGENTDVPDCKKISTFVFSLPDFDNLEGVKYVDKLRYKPELTLPGQILPIMTVDQFGHWVSAVLRKNTTSWLHYTMASWYWRVRGKVVKAMDCSRHAVHFAPIYYKDIALLNMGSILHHSRMTEDAVKLFKAAVDHAPEYDINYFALASAYAVLGDFDNSVRHFDRSLKINPGFDLAIKYRYGALCHAFLSRKMKVIYKTLGHLRKELATYATKEYYWIETMSDFMKTMKHNESFDHMNAVKVCAKMTQMTGIDMTELKKLADTNTFIKYYVNGDMFHDEWFKTKGVELLEAMYSLQKVMKHIGKYVGTAWMYVIYKKDKKPEDEDFVKKVGPVPGLPPGAVMSGNVITIEVSEKPSKKVHKSSCDKLSKKSSTSSCHKSSKKSSPTSSHKSSSSQPEDDLVELEVGPVLFPLTINVSRIFKDFDKDPEWPSNSQCEVTNFSENVEAIFSTFLPFENKGIRLKYLLTDKIKVPATVEHELPWHPPTCPPAKEAAGYTQRKSHKNQIVSEVVTTDFLRQKLLEYVHDGDVEIVKHMQDAEIGQRLYVAMKMNVAPRWLLYTLSSLYWRVRRNNVNALHCLITASKIVKKQFKDVVLASLASVFLEMDYFDEALTAIEECFSLNLYEPATNFILAEMNMLKNNRHTQLGHLKQVVRLDPGFMGGLPRDLLHGWACLLKQANTLHKIEYEGNLCTQLEPGVSLVCEGGMNCHMANVQCHDNFDRGTHTERPLFEHRQKKGKTTVASTYQKVLDITDILPPRTVIDDSIFDTFKDHMPASSADRPAHYENYEVMMRSAKKALRGCGSRPCIEIRPEELGLKLEDCSIQHMQLDFWLHTVTSAHLLIEPYSSLLTEIPSLAPSSKRIPDCHITIDPTTDFYVERMNGVDSEGWQPLIRPMQHIAEMFNLFDYVLLGAKFTKYVEINPRSWLALLGAGWWCGAGGRGVCAVRCLAAAHALAPPAHAQETVRALAALLYLQHKDNDAKEIAYLSFYKRPKEIEAVLVALTHAYLEEFDEAVWFFRYALKFDDKYTPARACIHAAICIMIFKEKAIMDHSDIKTST